MREATDSSTADHIAGSGIAPMDDEDLQDFFDNGVVALHLVGRDGRVLRANRAELDLVGYTAEEYIGRHIAEFHVDNETINDILARLTRGEKLDKYPSQLRAKDGSIKDVLISSSVRFHDGKFMYTRCFTLDVTDLKQAQQKLEDSEARLREVFEALPAAIYTTDAEGRITYYNPAAVEMSGRKPVLGTDEWCVTWKLFTADGEPLRHDECPMAVALKENRPVRGVEAIAERPDGTRVHFRPFPTPLRDKSGNLVGAVNMLVDISDRRRAETDQKLLINELNHRVKNTLAIVQSLVSQTMRTAPDPAEFSSRLDGRIVALSQAHDLLSSENWSHAQLDHVLTDTLSPYINEKSDNVILSGPVVALKPRAALGLSMVFHELATNAAKYGALSGADGRVHVLWSLDEGTASCLLKIKWTETAGPEVSAPSQRGFGTTLIERSVASELGGVTHVDYAPGGLQCAIHIPLESQGVHNFEKPQALRIAAA